MTHDRRIAGACGIVFPLALVGGMILASPPGGDYDANDVADFVASGHRAAVFISLYVILLAGLALVGLGSYLKSASFPGRGASRAFWGLTIAAAASFVAGWAIVVTPSTALAVGGGPGIDPSVAYTICQIGFGVMLFGGAGLLGCALLVLAAAGSAEPGWFRALVAVAGIFALATPLWFPLFGLLLCMLVVGIRLLASGSAGAEPAPAT